ncbi:FMN-linked oxidoreductase [Clavulina sp. PMI_390]|nr:FMN-linked oxidoreductase [Clavulina sp. PMI_390]
MSDKEVLGSSVSFPSGRVSLNRFVKAPLYEALATWRGGPPIDDHFGLYRLWAAGEWGMIISGNVQVSKHHLTFGRDMVVPEILTKDSIEPFQRLANVIHTPWPSALESDGDKQPPAPPHRRSLAIMQLSHAGRQSMNFAGGRAPFVAPLGASSIPIKSRAKNSFVQALYPLMFTPPKAASDEEVEDIIESFIRGAELAVKSGFDGVQLHGSHGYLLAQFISPKTNNRQPPYGPASSLFLIRTIILRIRAVVPPEHLVGIKLNAADYVQGGLTEEEALEHLRVIANLRTTDGRACVDFIEISGGDYETPAFYGVSSRQVYFASYSRRALEAVKTIPDAPRIILTGGFTSAATMVDSVLQNHTEMIGVGRGSIADPFIPRRTLKGSSIKNDSKDVAKTGSLAPAPIAAWWSPPDIFLNGSIAALQWATLMHERAAQGLTLMAMELVPGSVIQEDWLLPLTDARQHYSPFWGSLQPFFKRDLLSKIAFVAKSLSVVALAGIMLTTLHYPYQ